MTSDDDYRRQQSLVVATPTREAAPLKQERKKIFNPAKLGLKPPTWLTFGFFCHPDLLRSSTEHS